MYAIKSTDGQFTRNISIKIILPTFRKIDSFRSRVFGIDFQTLKKTLTITTNTQIVYKNFFRRKNSSNEMDQFHGIFLKFN